MGFLSKLFKKKKENRLKTKMLPCPFCGGKADAEEAQNWSGVKDWSAYCSDENCPMESVWTSGFNTEEEAIKVWNTRHSVTIKQKAEIS